MRLLLVTPMPPDVLGTGAIPALLHAQLVGLRSRHDVTLVTVAGPDAAEIEAVTELQRDGLDIHAVVRTLRHGTLGWRRRSRIATTWLRGGVPLRTAWFAEPGVQASIDSLAQRAFDAVIVEDNAMGLFSFPFGLPSILTEHEVRRPRRVAQPPRDPRSWPAWAFREADWRRWPEYERRVWRRFDVVQVFTTRDAAALVSLEPSLAGRVRVNPFPIVAAPADVDGGRADTLLFVGNYAHPPNVDAALWLVDEILPRIVRARPEVRLALAGPYAPDAIRSLAGERVDVLGVVADLDARLREASVVLAPVRTGGGMRMKVLHAMALGKPVVTTPRGAAGFDADGAELPLVVGRDADELAAAAVRLLGDEAARRALGERARAYVARCHSPEAYADRLELAIAAANVRRAPRAEGG
jgi:glycosyltransferase involved in cell wall biosynthesis